jgi:hypothetical protein
VIHKALGTYVPVPEESETVTEALLNALFMRNRRPGADSRQLDLSFDLPQQVSDMHRHWDRDAERERVNRSRFAQRALRPAEVRAELEATDAVLGDPDAVRGFVLDAARWLNLAIVRDKDDKVLRVPVTQRRPRCCRMRFASSCRQPKVVNGASVSRRPPPWARNTSAATTRSSPGSLVSSWRRR